MNILNKLTIKSLKLNKKRTIVTIIGIILSVALITAVSSLYSSLVDSIIEYEISIKGNFHFKFNDVNSDELNKFNIKEIDNYYLTNDIGYSKIDSINKYKPYAFIMGMDNKSFNNLGFELLSGNFPTNKDEIIIPEHLKNNGGISYKIGDYIELDVGNRESDGYTLNQNNPYTLETKEIINNSKKNKYKVVGIVSRPTTYIEPYSAPGYTFITLNNDSLKYDVYAKLKDRYNDKAALVFGKILNIKESTLKKFIYGQELNNEELEEKDNAKYKFDINDYLLALEENPIKNSGIGGLAPLIIFIIIIIMVTSIFCIKNSFDISITEKIKQYGILKSIGATKKQIKHNVLYEAYRLGLYGIPLGILCGLLATYILINVTNIILPKILEQNIKLVFSINIIPIIISFILSSITIYLSSLKSARKASKLSIIESIRNSSNITIKKKSLKDNKLINKLFGIGGTISYKNIKRNKRKYRTTTISIIVSVTIFIGLYYFINLFKDAVTMEYMGSEYNIEVRYNDSLNDRMNNILNYKEIDDYALIKSFNLFQYTYNLKYTKEFLNYYKDYDKKDIYYEYIDELGNKKTIYKFDNINIIKLDNNQFNNYLKKLNIKSFNDGAILINKELNYIEDKSIVYNRYNYKTNDYINLLDSETNKEYNIKIKHVTDINPKFVDNSINYIKLIINESYFDMIFKDKDLQNELRIFSNDPNLLEEKLAKEFINDDLYVRNSSKYSETMKSFVLLLSIFLYGFIIVISLIGITNIFNTITTSMHLRRQEFATLKSIGMTKSEFNRMISLESILLIVKSLIYGTIFGSIISIIIYYILAKDDPFLTYKYPIVAVLISIIVVCILIITIMKYSINKINKQNIIETIRNDNI